MKINDIYKVINYEKKKYYLFCFNVKDKYAVVRDCEWGYVRNDWISRSDPIEFIADRLKAVNSKTSTGIDTIKRIYYRHLPKEVKDLLKGIE